MIQHDFYAMGCEWSILCPRGFSELLHTAEFEVHNLEARLSRFRSNSALAELNLARKVRDAVVAEILVHAKAYEIDTDGAFSVSLGGALVRSGYDRTFQKIHRPHVQAPIVEKPLIEIHDADIELHGPGYLDLGGIAKGWTIDRVVALLAQSGVERALVDGGGDIRVMGYDWAIGVDDSLQVTLGNEAIATSSSRRRQWRTANGETFHHLIDPKSGLPSRSCFDTVSVIAPSAMTADVWATACAVNPDLLKNHSRPSLRVAGRMTDNQWYTTQNWGEQP